MYVGMSCNAPQTLGQTNRLLCDSFDNGLDAAVLQAPVNDSMIDRGKRWEGIGCKQLWWLIAEGGVPFVVAQPAFLRLVFHLSSHHDKMPRMWSADKPTPAASKARNALYEQWAFSGMGFHRSTSVAKLNLRRCPWPAGDKATGYSQPMLTLPAPRARTAILRESTGQGSGSSVCHFPVNNSHIQSWQTGVPTRTQTLLIEAQAPLP